MAFEGLTEKINSTFKKLRGKGRLKEADVKEAMREIRMALLEADVSYKVCKDFTKQVTERCVGTDVLESLTPAQMIIKIVNEELTKLMGSDTKHININPNGPTVVMLVGLQGAGKTTNGSKLAGLQKRQPTPSTSATAARTASSTRTKPTPTTWAKTRWRSSTRASMPSTTSTSRPPSATSPRNPGYDQLPLGRTQNQLIFDRYLTRFFFWKERKAAFLFRQFAE